jgi:LysM repeat protein
MVAFFIKTLIILVLAGVIFGGAAFYSYELFFKPEIELKKEKELPPPPPPPDPSLPAFLAAMEPFEQGDLLTARDALARFIDQNPHSLKVDEARDKLSEINTDLLFSTKPAPEKQVYVVRRGDVLTRVARSTKTSPELLMRANGLTGTMLRIDQRLFYSPTDFSVAISLKDSKVTVLNFGRFFAQYRILDRTGAGGRAGAPVQNRRVGKVADRIAWAPEGGRVIFTDKEYAEADFWITLTIPGHTLYSMPEEGSEKKPNRPPTGGIGVSARAASELAVMLSKGTPVTIEP